MQVGRDAVQTETRIYARSFQSLHQLTCVLSCQCLVLSCLLSLLSTCQCAKMSEAWSVNCRVRGELLCTSGCFSSFSGPYLSALYHFPCRSVYACTQSLWCDVIWQVVFTQFQYSDQRSVPPDAIRKAMALTFDAEDRFQLGLMEDAAECFVSRYSLTVHFMTYE